MKIQMESTKEIVNLDGVEARVWRAVTESGIECFVFVHRIAVRNDLNQAQFANELFEKSAPLVPVVWHE